MGSPFGDPSLGPGWGQGATTDFAQQLWQAQNPGTPAANNPYAGGAGSSPQPSAAPPGLLSRMFGGPAGTYSPDQLSQYYAAQQAMMPGQQISNPTNPYMNMNTPQAQQAAAAANASLAAGGTGAAPNMWDQLSKALGAGGGLQSGAGNLAKAFQPPTPMGPPTTQAPLPQGQMPTPPGLGTFFANQARPGGTPGISPQVLALRQLMQGS
jgi:hypothetical protein